MRSEFLKFKLVTYRRGENKVRRTTPLRHPLKLKKCGVITGGKITGAKISRAKIT